MMKNLLVICVLSVLLLSACDYHIYGSINNKTDSDIRIVCYLVEKSRWDTLEGSSLINYESLTGGAYFAMNAINRGEDSGFVMMNDSTYYVTLSPQESIGMGMEMNHFWTEERIEVYLQFLKRMEIQMPHDTVVYDGDAELKKLFMENKKSKQEIRINVKDNFFMKWMDKLS